MKKKILFRILLNTRFRDIKSANKKWMSTSEDESWLAYRVHIFMKYTAKSLIHQKNQLFTAIILYLDSTEEVVKRLLAEYEELPPNIIFLNQDKEETFMETYLKEDTDYIYEVRLDSDDCYIDTFVQTLHNVEITEETQCILSRWGYIWDHHSKRLGNVYYPSPPFYTLVYKPKEYREGVRYTLKGGHVGACRLNCILLEGEQYLFVLHESNILATFEHRMQKTEITDTKEKQAILERFGVTE